MAEGFANHYGSDVLVATSAGVSAMPEASPKTAAIMGEVGVDISGHKPSWYQPLAAPNYDLVVNMSGYRLPGKPPAELAEWKIEDPWQRPDPVYRRVRDELERRTMELILRLRKAARSTRRPPIRGT